MRLDPATVPQPYALLLLPSPPSGSFSGLRGKYEQALSAVYLKLQQRLNGANTVAILDIAVEIPALLSSGLPRSTAFASLQRLLANVYKLVCAISATENIELDFPGGIDTRVIFVDRQSASGPVVPDHGPIVSLKVLAESVRPWDSIYHIKSAAGKDLVEYFRRHLSPQFQGRYATSTYAVPGGQEGPSSSEPLWLHDDRQLQTPNYSVAVGGTFDHLHIGHKLLLTATVLALDPIRDTDRGRDRLITVGVTGDELLVNKKYAEYLESWDERCHSTASFLLAIMDFFPSEGHTPDVERVSDPGPNGKYFLVKLRPDLSIRLVQISDPCGPTITEESIDALVISAETRTGGKFVNDERAKKGWKALEIFEVDILLSGDIAEATGVESESFGSKISSTDIRRRHMDLAKK